MTVGTLSTIRVPGWGQLRRDTMQVIQNDRFFDTSTQERSAGNPIPRFVGEPTPIKHDIYI
jgi:hypothetical protein